MANVILDKQKDKLNGEDVVVREKDEPDDQENDGQDNQEEDEPEEEKKEDERRQ